MSESQCRICGEQKNGVAFDAWVKDTFTNHDTLNPGEVVCEDCLFWFEQRSVELQKRMSKDKPQKMQNYSHFVIGGEWEPVGKGDKRRMAALLLGAPFPEMAAVAVSGQKHLAFRARRNPAGAIAGWVQFEEQQVWVDPSPLKAILAIIEELYATFSKEEIQTGRYSPNRIRTFGLPRWQELEATLKPQRQTALFALALFLAQKDENDETK